MIRRFLVFSLFLIGLSNSPISFAQSSQESFGKNRVQNKSFRWFVISTANFNIYYYGNGIDLAIRAATYAEDDFNRITTLTGFTPVEKVSIVLFQSEMDKQQSNIGLVDQEILIGGQTVFIKTKIEVAFKGTQLQLMKDISYGVAHSIINTIMYGGNLKDVLKSSYLMSLPDWFVNGAAAYISEDWSQGMDDYMRDKVCNDKLKNPNLYSGEEATLIGQSIWNFIGKEYGEGNVFGVIGLTRAFRDEKQSIESNLGIDYKDFIVNWKKYYSTINLPLKIDYEAPSDSSRFAKVRRNSRINELAVNGSGTSVAFVQNFKGLYKVAVVNVAKGTKKNIARGGYKRSDQSIDNLMPVLAWKTESIVAVVQSKKGKVNLTLFDLKEKRKINYLLSDFKQVYSLSFSPDGNQLVMSADKFGQSDIFLYNLAAKSYSQLTNDAYDDLTPVITSDKKIIFSSNRVNDTVLSIKKQLPNYADYFKLYSYSFSEKNKVVKIPIEGNSLGLKLGSDNSIYFTNDRTGIFNVYTLNKEGQGYKVLTNQTNDVLSYGVFNANETIVYVSKFKGKEGVFKKGGVGKGDYELLPSTVRRNLILSFDVQEEYGRELHDTINYNFNSSDEVEFSSLLFESDVVFDTAQANRSDEVLEYVPIRYSNPMKYKNAFSTDKIVSTLMIDPLRGTGIFLESGMSDVLGNHRIDAGGFIGLDLRSTKLFGEYRFLKKRVDFKIRYDRQNLNPEYSGIYHKYILNIFGGTISYPLSVYHRVSLTPFVTTTKYSESTWNTPNGTPVFYSIAQRPVIKSYEALRAEYVFDNTLITGINMLKGTRVKFSAEYYVSNQTKQNDFGLLFFDIRKYIAIHKELVWANRASYGQYFGNAPKNFLAGGMDNWLFSNREFYSNTNAATTNPLTVDPGVENSDLLFLRYVTSVRGFRYNAQYGPKYLLLNSELRLPVVQYFYRGTIGSNFLRNLQLIGFADAGAAYTGSLNAANSVNVQTVIQSPFSATVTNYQSPFIVGLGSGIRTTFLGYYMKADLAWGIQNGVVNRPIFYFTFGYDF